jgi:hypothetical protein
VGAMTKGALMYDEPKQVYLRNKRGVVSLDSVFGETNRSWLTSHPWRPYKKAKNEHAVVSFDEYEQYTWDARNRRNISRMIFGDYGGHSAAVDTAVLRKVAELIGYEEKPR